MFISDFSAFTPPYLVPQGESLRWLAEAHANRDSSIGPEKFAKLIERFGCGPQSISSRGSFLRDFTHRNQDEMQIFAREPAGIDERTAFFSEMLRPVVAELYRERKNFAHWIHVTCTGYVSPSPIQEWVSAMGMGEQIQCLHAYHMGCYAAFPALRMARGNFPCEVLHTELCTLHFDAADHRPEQLVIQTLFADGVIRYLVTDMRPALGYEILETREIVAPATLDHMKWSVAPFGFHMALARETPTAVRQGVAQLVSSWDTRDAVYAIHPGGPRIIDAVAEALGLSEEQVHFSREILRCHGNMSSATLPHVWREMLAEIPVGSKVVSMAFGPGLTLSASLMRKVGPT